MGDRLLNFWRWLLNAAQQAAIAEAPAVMTAAGLKINRNTGKVEYNHLNDKGVKQLRSNLTDIGEAGATAPGATKAIETGYQKTLEFLKKYEGFKDTTYLDGNGIPTIGYGFTDPELVAKGYISRADADKRLEQEVMSREKELRSKIKNWANLSDDSKTALLSYYFNYPAGFKDTTRFMLNWNAGDYAAAIKEVDAGINDSNNPGLRIRRLAEQELLNSDPYLTGIKTVTTGDGNKKMIFPRSWKEPAQMDTWIPKLNNPQYPLDPANRAPESIDSWNGALSPSKGPIMPSILKQMDQYQRIYDIFNNSAVATGKKKTLPNLRNVLDRRMEDYIAGIMGVPDVYEEPGYTYIPMMYSPMPVFADGKLPKYEDGYLGTLSNFGIGMIPTLESLCIE